MNKGDAIAFLCEKLNLQPTAVAHVEQIHSGFTNFSFFTELKDGSKYQVRLARKDVPLNRRNEQIILDLVTPIFGNPFVYFDVTAGNAIKKWIEGKQPKRPTRLFLEQLVASLKKVHAVEWKQFANEIWIFDPLIYFNQTKLPDFYKKLYVELTDKHKAIPKTLCHHDSTFDNLVYTPKKQVVLIDFEWSCVDNPYYEIANIIREELTIETANQIIDLYGSLDKKLVFETVIYVLLFAFQWTEIMPQTQQIIDYKKWVQKRLNYFLNALFPNTWKIAKTIPLY
ncbi:hypothetical protein BIX54_03080 [Mycoplasmoides pneumoniae]|uniref:phosphotransferase family protein n=1 Tax=Mycoplasmoides pneumoniae TaxID=2104 RepID=UPI000A2A430E|nr:phosphotransferase family protein [Mycoplasmoides pneumoniae]ARQ33979.1 hypothetical protein BIX54_03080 [Mycoplasmoides pneumoniae]